MQPPISPVNLLHLNLAVTASRLRQGHPDGLDWLARTRELGRGNGQIDWLVQIATLVAQAAWLTGDLSLLDEEVLDVAAQAHRSDPWYYAELHSWLLRLGVETSTGHAYPEPYAAEICGDHRAAAIVWRERGCPFEEGVALYFAGDADSLRTALPIFDTIGAVPAATRCRRALRELGESVPRGARTATRANAAGLTPREAEVLDLLAQDLTNGQIAARLVLSSRTVDHHVSAVLAKLRVSSRAEAVAKARTLAT
jgi:DNA-binding CsgD family transcriptional regulator